MDLELGMIVLSVAVVTTLAVYFVSVMGIKEKTFEEAIAEQKKRSDDLLGKKTKKINKDKPKKKIKEPPLPIRRLSLPPTPPLKPILLNKEEQSPTMETTEELNNFLESHPKDEAELLHSRKPSLVTMATPPLTPPPLPPKEKKKKPLQLNIQALIKTAQLAPNEIQNLIELLLNKEEGNTDWSNNSKTDKLSIKKTLQEKETLLNEEIEASTQLKETLKKLRAEFNAEKGKATIIKKQLEDSLALNIIRVNELSSANFKIRQVSELAGKLSAEKLEAERNFNAIKELCGKLREDNESIKMEFRSSREQEGGYRGKLESLERELGALKTQYGHQGNQLQAAFQSNKELTQSVQTLQTQLRSLEERKCNEEHRLQTLYELKLNEKDVNHASELSTLKDALKLAEISASALKDALKSSESEIVLLRGEMGERNDGKYEELWTRFEEAKRDENILSGKFDEVNTLLERKFQEVNTLKGELQDEVNKGKELKAEAERKSKHVEDLRERNMKLMMTLKTTESDLDQKLKEFEILQQNEIRTVRVLSEKFPGTFSSLQDLDKIGEEDSLKEKVLHYQTVLENTELLLGNLQGSIEKEEEKWMSKLKEKDHILNNLQTDYESLKSELERTRSRLLEATPPPNGALNGGSPQAEVRCLAAKACSSVVSQCLVGRLKRPTGLLTTLQHTFEMSADTREQKSPPPGSPSPSSSSQPEEKKKKKKGSSRKDK